MKRKLFFTLLLLFWGSITYTQAQVALGGGLVYGSEVESLGIDLRATFDLDENWRIAPYFDYYFVDDDDNFFRDRTDIHVWTINVDANYVFDINNDLLGLYALAGLNLTTVKVDFNDGPLDDDDRSETDLGINLGMGLDFNLNKLTPFVELKYSFADNVDQTVLSFGLKFDL